MIKQSIVFVLILLVLSLQLSPVLAASFGSPPPSPTLGSGSPIKPGGPTRLSDWFQIVQQVVGWIFTIAIIVGVAMLIIAGIMYITSGGGGRTKTAGSMIIYAVVGIAVAALAWALVNLVGNFFLRQQLIR